MMTYYVRQVKNTIEGTKLLGSLCTGRVLVALIMVILLFVALSLPMPGGRITDQHLDNRLDGLYGPRGDRYAIQA